jgi:hypothetical protein
VTAIKAQLPPMATRAAGVNRAAEGIRAQVARIQFMLDGWKLPGNNTPLGDATAKDLRDAENFHRAQAAGNMRRANFYAQLRRGLKTDSQKVRARYSEEDLLKMKARFEI